MQLASRISPTGASLHKALCVFIQPECPQLWNIPIPKAQTHPAPCVSCVSHSNSPAFLLLRCTRILSQQVIAALWESLEPGEAVVSSGKDWAVSVRLRMLCKVSSWNTPGAFTQPCLLKANQQRRRRGINICKREKPLELHGLKAQRMEFPCLTGTGGSYFSSICNTVDLGSYINFLSWYNNACNSVVYLTCSLSNLEKICFILTYRVSSCDLTAAFHWQNVSDRSVKQILFLNLTGII